MLGNFTKICRHIPVFLISDGIKGYVTTRLYFCARLRLAGSPQMAAQLCGESSVIFSLFSQRGIRHTAHTHTSLTPENSSDAIRQVQSSDSVGEAPIVNAGVYVLTSYFYSVTEFFCFKTLCCGGISNNLH
jgi:hypothetical protein